MPPVILDKKTARAQLTGEFEKLLSCVHCGLCLDACPTYGVLGVEMDSPRGRLYLMRAHAEGRIGLTDGYLQHTDQCLLCRACETACPSGVRFGDVMEHAREEIVTKTELPFIQRKLRDLVFRRIFPHPRRLEGLVRAMRLSQRLGLPRLARSLGLGLLLPKDLLDSEAMLPPLPARTFRRNVLRINPAQGRPLRRVAFFSCCVNDLMLSEIDFATLRVLQRNGCEVIVLSEQRCSGALHVHAGEGDVARDLARHNIEAFSRVEAEAIITNSAGCGAQLKDYGHLLAGDAAWAERARTFSGKVRDISEYLDEIGIVPPQIPIDKVIAYADACHLAHAQGVRAQPRHLLSQIPGAQLAAVNNADRCCGSAGIYNITHRGISMKVLEQKIDDLEATGAAIYATGNPGCLMQIAFGARLRGLDVEVTHPIVLLDRAYGEE